MKIEQDLGLLTAEKVVAQLQIDKRFTNCSSVFGGFSAYTKSGLYVRIISDLDSDLEDIVFAITGRLVENETVVVYTKKVPKGEEFYLDERVFNSTKFFPSPDKAVDFIFTETICQFAVVGL
jgi:hypothetical protein